MSQVDAPIATDPHVERVDAPSAAEGRVGYNLLAERVDASGAPVAPLYAVCEKTTPKFNEVEMALETMYSEVKSLLPPLSAEESASLDAARSATADVEASNTVEYDLSAEVDDIVNNAASGVANTRITFYNAKALLKEGTARDGWNVSAVNDNGQSDGFATFASTWLDQVVSGFTPIVNERIDTYGRRYFALENGILNNTVAVVFDVQGRKMLKISDILLPLDEFLSIVSCNLRGNDPSKVGGELRSGNEVGRIPSYVECVFPTRTLKIYDINTVTIMSILTHLSKVFSEEAPIAASIAEPIPAIPKNEKGYSWLIGGIAGAFVSGMVYGAALLSQRCM